MAENPSPVKDGNLRKIEIMPSRSEETNDGKTEQVEHAEGCTTNEISFGHSAMTEVQMFVLSQIRVSNLFFVFISILDQFQKTTTLGKLSTIGPLCIVIVTQAVIAMKAFCKDKKRVKEVNERADFKLATKGKNGPPQFRKRSLEDVKPGDLLSFEPKPGEKSMERQAPERTAFWSVNNFNNLKINFVPRGSLIYNAEIVYAIAVYTGDDTKVAFHLKEAKEGWKSKRVPIMDEMTDKVFLALLYFILAVSLLIEVIQYSATKDKTFNIFEWLNVLQKCIPISLIMLLEVINYFITYRITKEKKGSPFSHKETSELGHVTHMILDRNTICGNHLEVELLGTKDMQERVMPSQELPSQDNKTIRMSYPDPSKKDTVRSSKVGPNHLPSAEEIDLAKTALAICHRVEDKTEDKGDVENSVPLTEEDAMIKAAARLGYVVQTRSSKEIRLKKRLTDEGEVVRHFQIRETIPFSPTDEMAGMYVKETGKDIEEAHRLFLKGTRKAFEKLGKDITAPDFKARGLSTIFFAEAKLSGKEWQELELFVEGVNYQRNKNSEKVRQLMEEFFPASLRVVGSVGIKFVVNDETQGILNKFKEAEIRMLLTNEADHLANKPLIKDMPCFTEDNTYDINENEDRDMETVLKEMKINPEKRICLTMSGDACQRILNGNDEAKKMKLQHMLRKCSLTILSQMTPQLKATIVDLMSERTDFSLKQRFVKFFNPSAQRESSILVVGDSTDDVSMMLQADLSIYIDNGEEKCYSDAKYLADFVCTDLKELQELILVHGTVNKRALSEVIFYSIYRNLLFVIVQTFFFLYMMEDPDAGENTFKVFSVRNSTWYVVYTSIPALAAGLCFKPFKKEEILQNPAIYNEPRQSVGRSKRRLAIWGLAAFVHAIIVCACFFLYMHIAEEEVYTSKKETLELENGDSIKVTWKNFVEHRAYLIIAVVLVVCSKIGLSEGIIMPWPGSKLKPKMVVDRWMLATGAISVVLVTLLHIVPGLRELVEKEEPNFEWDAFLPSILVVLLGTVGIDLLWHTLEYILWLRRRSDGSQSQP